MCHSTRKPITPTRSSQDGTLKLSLSNIHASRSVLASIRANPSLASRVTGVVLLNTPPPRSTPPASSNTASPQDVICLLRDIGECCPRIASLSISLDTTTSTSTTDQQQPAVALPIAALTAFFGTAPRYLVSLKISSAVLSANTESSQDFVELAQAMRHATSWKEMRLEFCEPAPGTCSLDPLLECLQAAPFLQQLALSGTTLTHSGLCTGPSLAKLVHNNTTLQTLTIWGGKRHVQTADVCALVQALETNSCLRELTLHALGLDATCGRAVARCLTVNRSLERLILNVSDDNHSNNTQRSSDYVITTTLLAKALQRHNRTLRLLSLDYCPQDDNERHCTTSVAAAAAGGDSSHDFDFYEPWQRDHHSKASLRKNAETVREAFTHMLHGNPVLEVLWMNLDNNDDDEEEGVDEDDCNEEVMSSSSVIVTAEMEMLLRLNRYGIRQTLFEEKAAIANSEDWIDAIASQSYDINALFYLVSRNPSLCSTATRHHGGTKRSGSTPTNPTESPSSSTIIAPPQPTKRQRTTTSA